MVLALMAVEIETIPIRTFINASIYNHHTDVVGSYFTIDTKLIKVDQYWINSESIKWGPFYVRFKRAEETYLSCFGFGEA